MTLLAAAVLAAAAAGGVAYVFLYPLLSGSARAEKRQRALVTSGRDRRTDRAASATASRREPVAQSLKDVERRGAARNKVTTENRIAQAGLTWSTRRFFVLSAGLGFGLGAALLAITGAPVVAAGGLLVGGLGLPRWVLGYLRKRRIARFLNELPNAMDVIVRGIKSGLPLGDCLRIISNEAQEPVRTEFRVLLEQQALGITVADAVGKLYERVPVTEANFFSIVISIQQKAGGNLSEALGNLSRVLRDRKKMRGKIQAMSMEAKASASIIGALPFTVGILVYLTSPSYIEVLWLTNVGKVCLIVSGFWMMTGIFVMKKMINFNF